MSIGTPVLITKTEGFWDKDNFKDQEDIFFIDDDNYESWITEISRIIKNKNLCNKISTNSKAKVRNQMNNKVFFNNLQKYLS